MKKVTEFKRQERYVVLKIADIKAYLSDTQIYQLCKIAETVTAKRADNGKLPLKAVVVEHDWPEYEPTWAAIEARVKDSK